MIRPIRAVKKEIRILGLDTCNPRLSIGVIIRGGLNLDGVIPNSPNQKRVMREWGRRIVDSAYFPELRAIMLHDPDDELDSSLLERITGLPTMLISRDNPSSGRGYQPFDGSLGRLWFKTRLESSILKEILSISWSFGKLPEPLRVAHLLARLDLRSKSSG